MAQSYRRNRGNTIHNPSTEKFQNFAAAAATKMIFTLNYPTGE